MEPNLRRLCHTDFDTGTHLLTTADFEHFVSGLLRCVMVLTGIQAQQLLQEAL